jgi:phage gp46-like protein
MSESILNGDVKLFQTSPEWADVKLLYYQSSSLILDDGLENAILISLLTNKRASDTDELPDLLTDKQGWFGDELTEMQIGSKLWLLRRSKKDNVLFVLLKQYSEDALQWMITDKVIDSVAVNVSHDKTDRNRVILSVSVEKQNKVFGFAYYYNWQNQTANKVLL